MYFSRVNSMWLGAALWVSSIQYFIVQVIVIGAWTVPHSFANNFISDLGNTECGTYAGLAVCSPLHLLMNVSFVVFGITMAAGAVLLSKQSESTTTAKVGFVAMIAAGVGTMMVGLFPENTVGPLHLAGAILGLGVGNVSVLLLGLGLRQLHPFMRGYTIASAVVSLGAFALFAADVHAGLGRGGIERLVSYPFTVWMISMGLYLLTRRRTRSR